MKNIIESLGGKLRNFFDSAHFVQLLLVLGIFTVTIANMSHAYIGSFSRFGADDYCTAGKLNTLGFWSAQSFWYTNWTGRFSFTFFVSLIELLDSRVTAILPFILIILLTISVLVFINQISKNVFKTTKMISSLFLASAIVFMILFTIPNIGQNLYWMTGSVTYFFPIILFFLLCSLLVSNKNHSQQIGKKIFIHLLIFISTFLVAGFSEVLSVLQILIFGFTGIFMVGFRKSFKFPLELSIALMGATVGLVLMISAPGNSVRLGNHLPHPNIFELISSGLALSLKFTLLWFVKNINIIWPFISIFIVFGFFLKCPKSILDYLLSNKYKITSFLIITSFFLIFSSYLPSIWATAKPPVDRVLIFPVVILCSLVLLLGIIVGLELNTMVELRSLKKSIFLIIVLTLTVVYFLLGVPLYQARINYANRAEARTFAEKWEDRELQIKNQINEGKSELKVNMIPNNILNVEHIQQAPDHWINICAAEYYGVETIIAE